MRGEKFAGPVEVDETYVGGRERNKHAKKKLHAGRGTVGKTGVAGARDQPTNQVRPEVIHDATKPTLHDFVERHTAKDATIYTDEHGGYRDLHRAHGAVAHGWGQYVDGDVSANGIESHWAVLKRGYIGVYHWMSVKHLPRYLREFCSRQNTRAMSLLDHWIRWARWLLSPWGSALPMRRWLGIDPPEPACQNPAVIKRKPQRGRAGAMTASWEAAYRLLL